MLNKNTLALRTLSVSKHPRPFTSCPAPPPLLCEVPSPTVMMISASARQPDNERPEVEMGAHLASAASADGGVGDDVFFAPAAAGADATAPPNARGWHPLGRVASPEGRGAWARCSWFKLIVVVTVVVAVLYMVLMHTETRGAPPLVPSGASEELRPCERAALAGTPLCDETRPPRERAAWITSQLDLQEKAHLTWNTAAGVPRLNLPPHQWWSEALHGVAESRGVSFGGIARHATSFPQVVTTGCAFNRTLWRMIGQAIADEARAFNNVGHAGLTYWSPNVNLVRDPRWGRSQEVPGEDPYAVSVYAVEFVKGMQEGEDPHRLKVSACCKHLYAYDMDRWGGVDRHGFDAIVTKQDEADTYLPVFHACVRNANVSGLMCAYNRVNGTPGCVNSRVMNELARDAWGFEGYVTSDCQAVKDITEGHHYGGKDYGQDQAIRDAFGAGMDTACVLPQDTATFSDRVPHSVRAGVTSGAALDRAVTHLFMVHIRLGLYDKAAGQPYLRYGVPDTVNTARHKQLALEAALQGIVLLKNEGTLPLSVADGEGNIALVGPSGNATVLMQGNYQGVAPFLVSPLEGIAKFMPVNYEPGCADHRCSSDELFHQAGILAGTAHAVVVVLGLSQALEGEGEVETGEGAGDRVNTALPGKQDALVEEVAARAEGGPVVVVVMSGASVDLSRIKANPRVGAILFAGYPGQAGGDAVAQVLFGKHNPSGRLAFTMYADGDTQGVSMLNMGFRPDQAAGNPGRTYRFFTGTPVFAFGEGLSYTTFEYALVGEGVHVSYAEVAEAVEDAAKAKAYSWRASDEVLAEARVRVSNSGARAGCVVVQAFMRPPPTSVPGAPLQFLVAFEKVCLAPGASAVVAIPLTYTAFSLADKEGRFHAVRQDGWSMFINYNEALVVPVAMS